MFCCWPGGFVPEWLGYGAWAVVGGCWDCVALAAGACGAIGCAGAPGVVEFEVFAVVDAGGTFGVEGVSTICCRATKLTHEGAGIVMRALLLATRCSRDDLKAAGLFSLFLKIKYCYHFKDFMLEIVPSIYAYNVACFDCSFAMFIPRFFNLFVVLRVECL